MTNTQKWLLGIAIAAIILLIIFWKNVKAFFTTPAGIPKTDYEKCVEANAALPDGADCGNCIPEGSTIPSYAGKIVNGICQPIQQAPPVKIVQFKIITPTGASVYKLIGGNFITGHGSQLIPVNTVLQLNTLIEQGGYIKISQIDWLLKADVQVMV